MYRLLVVELDYYFRCHWRQRCDIIIMVINAKAVEVHQSLLSLYSNFKNLFGGFDLIFVRSCYCFVDLGVMHLLVIL